MGRGAFAETDYGAAKVGRHRFPFRLNGDGGDGGVGGCGGDDQGLGARCDGKAEFSV